MTETQLAQYDLFLDENDWDIYYWATQDPHPESPKLTADATIKHKDGASYNASQQEALSKVQGNSLENKDGLELMTDKWRNGKPRSGEWAQTVGTFKPDYRPVPARWKNSEILAMLRRHVISRSAGGISDTDGKNSTGGGGQYLSSFAFINLC